jgi:hypothetical protein
MRTGRGLRRAAGIVALMTSAATGAALANPADASTGPTATLSQGVVTVTGTPAATLSASPSTPTGWSSTVGFDGTVDAQFKRSRVQRVRVVGGEGDDGLTVDGSGVGDLPITMRGAPATTSWALSARSARSAPVTSGSR